MHKRRTLLSMPLLSAAFTACGGRALAPAAAAAPSAPGGPSGPSGPRGPQAAPEGQHALQLRVPGVEAPVRLLLYRPPGWDAPARRWPLVVFLHGSGERGGDVERVKAHGLPKLLAQGARPPCTVASPQLDAGERWQPDRLHRLLQALLAHAQGRVDEDRVLATGLSLGGHGAWAWAAAYPRDLAAIAPVCGFGDPKAVCNARRVPVRAYHGAADAVVPLALQQASVDALRACGGSVDFTVYEGVGHDAWTPAYDDPALLPWLLRQTRRAA